MTFWLLWNLWRSKMPIRPSDVKTLAGYEREAGIDTGAPLGTHQTNVERAEVREDEETGEPFIFALLRIDGGDAANRTIPRSFRWYAKKKETKEEQKRAQGFIRKQTMDFVKAALGKDMGTWSESVTLPDTKNDSYADTKESFETIASAIKGAGVEVTVTTQMKKDAAGKLQPTD